MYMEKNLKQNTKKYKVKHKPPSHYPLVSSPQRQLLLSIPFTSFQRYSVPICAYIALLFVIQMAAHCFNCHAPCFKYFENHVPSIVVDF